MYPHHRKAIERMCARLARKAEVLAVIIGGSIAHGFEGKRSDVDAMIVLTEEAYRERKLRNRLHYLDLTSARYPGGYAEGKFIDMEFLARVAEKGSDPARFAFKDSFVGFARVAGIEELIGRIARYPEEEHEERLKRFQAQFEAWHWYAGEGFSKENPYLVQHAASQMNLFAGRLILGHNRMLYPYHKWLIRVLESAPEKPVDLIETMLALSAGPDRKNVARLHRSVNRFRKWGLSQREWPEYFMRDSELTWMEGPSPIADI